VKKFEIAQEITKNLNLTVRASSKNITQVAKEAGITQSSLSHFLSGRNTPSVFTLVMLCRVLDCNYEDILGRL